MTEHYTNTASCVVQQQQLKSTHCSPLVQVPLATEIKSIAPNWSLYNGESTLNNSAYWVIPHVTEHYSNAAFWVVHQQRLKFPHCSRLVDAPVVTENKIIASSLVIFFNGEWILNISAYWVIPKLWINTSQIQPPRSFTNSDWNLHNAAAWFMPHWWLKLKLLIPTCSSFHGDWILNNSAYGFIPHLWLNTT